MGIYFEELIQELESQDQNCLYLTLIKLLRIPTCSIVDSSNYYLLHRHLRNMCLVSSDTFTDILFSIRDKFDECFSLEFPSEDFNPDCANKLLALDSRPQDLVTGLFQLCDFNQGNDFDLCNKLINHENDLVRCAALEVYQYRAEPQHIHSIIHLLTEKSPRVLKFVIRFLDRFGLEPVIECLSDMIKSDKNNLRITAIKCLARLETNTEIVSLLSDASKFGLEPVRLLAIKALALHATPDSIKTLRELQNDISIEICETARTSIEKMEQIRSQKILIKNNKSAFSEK